jgi:hypothetical protein
MVESCTRTWQQLQSGNCTCSYVAISHCDSEPQCAWAAAEAAQLRALQGQADCVGTAISTSTLHVCQVLQRVTSIIALKQLNSTSCLWQSCVELHSEGDLGGRLHDDTRRVDSQLAAYVF